MTKAPKKDAKPTTKFRAHFRTSDSDDRKTMDVDAHTVQQVHDEVYKKYRTDDVQVRIDKVKVRAE